ncbi:MAG: hypothetical protein HYT08_00080 [Candidatus Levybacteria bacterium]|nr:hypothetical protein [Candidatus Levybacteria bacterium]
MKSDINLLSRTKVESAIKGRLSNILKIISLISITGVLFTSFVLFILARQLSVDSIREKQNAVIKNINFLKERHARLIVSNQKIEEISQIIKKRAKFDNNLRTVYSKVPGSVSSQSIALDRQKISMNITSSSLISINEFINNFTEMAKSKKLLQDLTVGSIALDPKNGNYSLNIEAQIL